MDCGVPFCQSSYGCPVYNLVPEWNDLLYRGRDREAWLRLRKTNNFPEFTGRVCPAPCEGACVLGIGDDPVTIKDNECWIADNAREQDWVQPVPPASRTGKKVAVIGSGPSGLAAADQLNCAGHLVTVFERADRPGGLLMYGIPNMKLDKNLVLDRIQLMKDEGVEFCTSTEIGVDMSGQTLLETFDAVLIASGSTRPRDLAVPGRKLAGIHFAMDYLKGSTVHVLSAATGTSRPAIDAKGKKVLVIGGGDTGNDCIGTAIRQGCTAVVNFELLPKPPLTRTADMPWPTFPRTLKTDYGHAEAESLRYTPSTASRRRIVGDENGNVIGVRTIRVEGKERSRPVRHVGNPGSEEYFDADLVFRARLPRRTTRRSRRGQDGRGNATQPTEALRPPYQSFCRRGCLPRPVLGRLGNQRRPRAAREIDRFLMGETVLP